MTPPTVTVFTYSCDVRVGLNDVCSGCGRPATPVTLVERREVRTFDVVNKRPPIPPWARAKPRRVTRPGRR